MSESIAESVYGTVFTTCRAFTKKGIINVNNVNIHYTVTNDAFECGLPAVSHFCFESVCEGKVNAISETGYKSHFRGEVDDLQNENIIHDTDNVVRMMVEYLVKENGETLKEFSFGKGVEREVYQQTSLFF